MRILEKLNVPVRLDRESIDEAFVASRDQLLRGNMSRFDFADVAYHAGALRLLPVGHLIDHRLRSPLIPPIDKLCSDISDSDWSDSSDAVAEWLAHMLEPSDRLGGRKLVARVLSLDPIHDASLLVNYGARSQRFYRRCVRGRLHCAVSQIERDFPTSEHQTLLALISRLMIYFSCFSIHLVAARAWWVDHFLSEDGDTADITALLSSMNYLANLADASAAIGDYMTGSQKRYPRRDVVGRSMPIAKRWRSSFQQTDDELREMIASLLTELKPQLDAVRNALARARADAGSANPTVHRALFGITAGEALAFGSTRLVQLRDAASAMIDDVKANKQPMPLGHTRSSYPPINSSDVSALLYVFRITTLRDPAASWTVGNSDGEPLEFVNPNADLAKIFAGYVGNENSPGFETINTARQLCVSDPVGKKPLRKSLVTVDGAIDWSLFDVRPDFWLGLSHPTGAQHGTKGTTVPPGPKGLLMRKRAVDEQNRQHRPPNRWRASGRDQPRKQRPRKR